MQRHVEGDDAKIPRELFIGQQMPPLPAIGARGVQADQRNARAVLLEIDAVHLAADLDVDVAADHRLDHDRSCRRPSANIALPRQRQHVLEVLQIRHEGMQIAFQHRLPALGQREQIVPARPRHRLPILPPTPRCRPVGKSPRAHQHRRRRQLDDPARADRDMKRMARSARAGIRNRENGRAQSTPALRSSQRGNSGKRLDDSGVGGVRS